MSITRLFLDWMHVHKGAMEATYDPAQISEEGYATIERNKKMFGIHPDLSGHGMKRNRLPFGVKIAIEPARKSAPWLDADKPWEKALNYLTIIHEDGKFRCWYCVAFPKPLGGENAEQTFQQGGSNGYAWAQWDDGRIAGIEAADHGEFWTGADICTGSPIEMNARTSKVGRGEVELWESQTWFVSKPIPGYGFEDCIPLRGDELWTPLRWRGKADLSELKSKRIQLRVRMSSAKIFGYRLLETR